jgi:thiamine pyrophosphokinase
MEKKARRAVIFIGGAFPNEDLAAPILLEADYRIAADSGLSAALALGVVPDLVVGDMDSIPDLSVLKEFPPERVMRFPVDKDETDTEIALRVAGERGYDETVLIGGGGGRMDHFIALLSLFERDRHPIAWLTDKERISAVDSDFDTEASVGETFSFFPVGPGPCVMRSSGLKWNLDGLAWGRGDFGVSNRAAGNRVTVHMISGRLLAVRALNHD